LNSTHTDNHDDFISASEAHDIYYKTFKKLNGNDKKPLIKLKFKEKLINLLPNFKSEIKNQSIGHKKNIWVGYVFTNPYKLDKYYSE
tara:strand:- start:402 stop:662 length:261 start_codon:yes stop_codon:yes gene_type:complete